MWLTTFTMERVTIRVTPAQRSSCASQALVEFSDGTGYDLLEFFVVVIVADTLELVQNMVAEFGGREQEARLQDVQRHTQRDRVKVLDVDGGHHIRPLPNAPTIRWSSLDDRAAPRAIRAHAIKRTCTKPSREPWCIQE